MAADSKRTGSGKIQTVQKMEHLIDKFYIATGGSQMDETRKKSVNEIQTNNINKLSKIITEIQKQYRPDFAELSKKISDSDIVQPSAGATIILFGIDENQQSFLKIFDDDDNFTNPSEDIKYNQVFGTGTNDLQIEEQAAKSIEKYEKKIDKNEFISLDKWAFETMLNFAQSDDLKATVDFPVHCVLITTTEIVKKEFSSVDKMLQSPKNGFENEFKIRK